MKLRTAIKIVKTMIRSGLINHRHRRGTRHSAIKVVLRMVRRNLREINSDDEVSQ